MTDERGVPAKYFHEAYESGAPAWEVGRPQPDVVRLAEEGLFAGRILDCGCGTGENALFLAGRGLQVRAFDSVPRAIDLAKKKAAERGLRNVTFEVRDALTLGQMGETFDTLLDSGLFHIFSDDDRARYVAGLTAAAKPGGRLILNCFSDAETSEVGPRRVKKEELEAAFAKGWEVEQLEPSRYASAAHPGGAKAWLAVFRRRRSG